MAVHFVLRPFASVVALLAATRRAVSGRIARAPRRHRAGGLGRLGQRAVGLADHAVRRARSAGFVCRDVLGASARHPRLGGAAARFGTTNRHFLHRDRAVFRDLSGVATVRGRLARFRGRRARLPDGREHVVPGTHRTSSRHPPRRHRHGGTDLRRIGRALRAGQVQGPLPAAG